MNKKINVLTLFIFLFSISSLAQVSVDIIRPSVNAEQFGLALKAETALSKGQLSLNIPLMELKGKGYNLPISLTFYSGDVTFRTEASPVGLGWALMAGGVITKTVRGAEDIDTSITNKAHHYDGNYLLDNWMTNDDLIFEIQNDPLPDEYTYSLPGHSGTIDVSVDGNTTEMVLYPDETYRIESTGNGLCITADDGTKFYFEDAERRTVGSGPDFTESMSWFLTRIVTTKGGCFTFNYAEEEYVDLSTEENEIHFQKYRTKRITSIVSDFGSVTFNAAIRYDRDGIGNRSIANGMESKRINKIELRDENGTFVKGYELDNSGLFESRFADPYNWCDHRHKLSSITQYDATGNRLPPYSFTYDYRFSKSKLAEATYQNGECRPRDAWTGYVGAQVYVDLESGGNPLCHMWYPNTQYPVFEGITIQTEDIGTTANDYFCLTSIDYPTGATEVFTYEPHSYSKVNLTKDTHWRPSIGFIHGKRLAVRERHGSEFNQRTEYIYKLHDADYNANGASSGVLTNPSIFTATYYTPEPYVGVWQYRSSRISSGKAFNSFMGPPVCYTEVEEVEKEDNDVLSRTIHYFEPQLVSPPVNYIMVKPSTFTVSTLPSPSLIEVGNRILGKKSGYIDDLAYLNNDDMTYITYPVGEFYSVASIVDQPIKEVFIGIDGDVRSIKEYTYSTANNHKKYGYKIVSQDYYQTGNPPTLNYTAHLISVSEYLTQRFRICSIGTTRYYNNNENTLDSIFERYIVNYNKGRVCYTSYTRSNEKKITNYYFPGDIVNMVGNSASPPIEAMNGLVERNMVADPIKTIMKRNGQIIGGECKDYQMTSGMPLLKSLYKLKNTANNNSGAPTVNGDNIDYLVDLYKEGEIMTYDANQNPAHVRLNDTQDRIYVWGYGGRFPIAVIDNMNHTAFQAATDLRSAIMQLETYKKIETGDACTSLRNLNATIRSLLPGDAHITTYTYDPYFGMTSETDDSNLGTIFTYDSFGRLTAKYDVNYKKLEEYNYHYKLQQ